MRCLTYGEMTTDKFGLTECAVSPCEVEENFKCERKKMRNMLMADDWTPPQDPVKGERHSDGWLTANVMQGMGGTF